MASTRSAALVALTTVATLGSSLTALTAAPGTAEARGCARTTATMLVTGKPATGLRGTSGPTINPPMTSFAAFAKYMHTVRGDTMPMLRARWARFQQMVRNRDLVRDKEKRAFLAAPREEFSRNASPERSYASKFLSIGCGVTISGPNIVGKMTTEIDVQPGDKVLEVGTGSGYQSSILSYLTKNVYTIEIIPDLAATTNELYDKLAAAKYKEYNNIHRKQADGYFGWKEHAPFDKIIVTAGLDHIPPPLLRQLKVGGIMVIPIGPAGCHKVLRVEKHKTESGRIKITRKDIYASRRVGCTGTTFVPFTAYTKGGKTISRYRLKKK